MRSYGRRGLPAAILSGRQRFWLSIPWQGYGKGGYAPREGQQPMFRLSVRLAAQPCALFADGFL